ncbi:MAG: 3-keto-disaccharide hydrolase [Gemmatimonadaceae bacterium]
MLRLTILLLTLGLPSASGINLVTTRPAPKVDEKMLGRWDITIATPEGPRPSWLEMEHSGRDVIIGRFVGIVGSARPISQINASGDSFSFSIPYQWEDGNGALSVKGNLRGSAIGGTMIFPDGKSFRWTGVRSPRLDRRTAPAWGAPVRLLHANDLGGWHASGPTNQWIVRNGVLSSPHSGANLITDRTFGDFKLHVEFRYPKESNSGVYLRGRYEVQIQDDYGNEPWNDRFSGIYGFISPSVMAAKPAGQWQAYDITLVGRLVSVVANGVQVICNQEIPGITGGALDSNEGAPGPIFLQGDHGPVEYRNIVITPGG